VSATPQSPQTGSLVLAISAGGPASGSFVADTDFSGGTVSGGTKATIKTTGVTNPPPQSVLQHGRYGNMTYTVPNLTAGASYTVRLDFVEYAFNAAGSRVFNVAINGTQVLSDFDIWSAAGGENIALAKLFTATASSAGKITITFTSVVNNSMINGIEIYTSGGAGPTAAIRPALAAVVAPAMVSQGPMDLVATAAPTTGSLPSSSPNSAALDAFFTAWGGAGINSSKTTISLHDVFALSSTPVHELTPLNDLLKTELGSLVADSSGA
ncbi:MAG TPA: malectin domain-containing carbohydrate-binding protein, partial [Planctomycetaceae bacterium]|nr:malectin domain-containing carbohydrate-binding protein [Planctomycetaceae bacterium]